MCNSKTKTKLVFAVKIDTGKEAVNKGQMEGPHMINQKYFNFSQKTYIC